MQATSLEEFLHTETDEEFISDHITVTYITHNKSQLGMFYDSDSERADNKVNM